MQLKAVVFSRYGSPDVLQIQDVAQPVPGEDEVLVKVRAISLNPADWHMRNGMLMARLLLGTGVLRPKHQIPGADFAGTVEAVGRNVTQYKPGDEVFGRSSPCGFAEYLCVTEKPIAPKPANITFEQAAAVPIAALTALQSLRDVGQVHPGQKVLINGASGGVGTFTVQMAKAFGAEVTAVCSTRNLDLVRSLGADRVIDYTEADFTRTGQRYDLLIDNVGNRSIADLVRVLSPEGRCVSAGFSSVGRVLKNALLKRFVIRKDGPKFAGILARIISKDLAVVAELMEAGKVVPVIDRRYALGEVREAFRYAEQGHARGKVVIALDHP